MVAELEAATAADTSIVNAIASKIQKGQEEVLPSDIQQLWQISKSNPTVLPFLDRTFLQTYNVPDMKRHVTLVRYRGMVQDMLDSEYYMSHVRVDDPPSHGTTTTTMVHTKYRDYYPSTSATGDALDVGHDLAERHLLMVVPIPFESKYHRSSSSSPQLQLQDPSRNVIFEEENEQLEMQVESSRRGTNKRRAHDNNHDDLVLPERDNAADNHEENDNHGRFTSPRRKQRPTPPNAKLTTTGPQEHDSHPHTNNNNNNNNNNDGWWSEKGMMDSDVTKCPVLAKLYYDEDQNVDDQDRLKLNEIVDFIGVLSLNPLDVDFSQQQQQHTNGCGDGDGDGDDDDDGDLLHNLMTSDLDYFGEEDRFVIPPPSVLPRLHVLAYTRHDLDHTNSHSHTGLSSDSVPATTGGDGVVVSPTKWQQDSNYHQEDDRTFTIDTLSNVLFQGKNSTAAEAVLMALLSMAERTEAATTTGSVGPVVKTEESTLGCASLNLVLSNTNACTQLYTKLQYILKQICPVVANLQLDGPSLNNGSVTSPARGNTLLGGSGGNHNNAKLLASPLQLPKGSTVLLNQSSLQEGTQMNQNATQTLLAMSTLTKSHWIPYRFDEGMAFQYNFEADYRMIVLSSRTTTSSHNRSSTTTATTPTSKRSNNNKSSKILPCTFKMELGNDVAVEDMDCDDTHNNDSTLVPQESILRIRSYLSRCRSSSSASATSNVGLTREVLQQAEKDFIERRKTRRVAIATGVMSKNTPEIGEDDFHRWLTLTRLQARSRRGLGEIIANEKQNGVNLQHQASVMDWNAALRLDDAMHVSAMD